MTLSRHCSPIAIKWKVATNNVVTTSNGRCSNRTASTWIFDTVRRQFHDLPQVRVQRFEIEATDATGRSVNYATSAPPVVTIQARAPQPAAALQHFLDNFEGRVLVAGESTGRREIILDTLSGLGLRPVVFESWEAFLASDERFGVTVAPLEQGLVLREPALAIIAGAQLLASAPVSPDGAGRPPAPNPKTWCAISTNSSRRAGGARTAWRRPLSRPGDHPRRRHPPNTWHGICRRRQAVRAGRITCT